MPVVVLVHDRREAEAALRLAVAQGLAIELVIPLGIAGPAFARALEEVLGRALIGWCDDRPGLALEALRAGLRRLVVLAPPETTARLADIAAQLGGTVQGRLPGPLQALAPDGGSFVAHAPEALGPEPLGPEPLGSSPLLVP